MSKDTSSPTKPISALDDYVLLGPSGLRVSPLCLGALGLGSNYEESKKVFDLYYEKGGNFFDTACNYNMGESERFLGDYVSDKRSDVVIATKFSGVELFLLSNVTNMQKDKRYNPNSGGNHRKSLVENLDASLKRLNMSYVDILYVHFYEYRTPIEEFMRSLDDVIRSGKVLYAAVSDMPAWALSRSNTIAELRGWSPFIGLQTRYNLLERTMETDLQLACAEHGVGIIPWGVVAEGFLTGKYSKENSEATSEFRNRFIAEHSISEKNWKILDEVKAISEEIGRTPVQVTLNWTMQKPGITSPLIGAKTVNQLEENLKALEFKLTPEQMKRLDDVSEVEHPFPYKLIDLMDLNLGKNINIPTRFEPFAAKFDYRTRRNL
ncbi:rhizopine catabolism protein [Rhizophagus irregularis]|uniref:Rhizopine catabolism protein n=1 Tax=Rhizophagus irregularis TaxID=588596 RepID=A0A2N1MST1_9GLOM|nr:rhizopine catabolism protein [Rhizophagus irregularis]